MKNTLSYLLIMFGLISCGGSDDDRQINNTTQTQALGVSTHLEEIEGLSDLLPGAYSIALGNTENLKVGNYYQSESNEKLLIINGDEQKAEVIAYALPQQAWNIINTSNDSGPIYIHQHEKINDEVLNISAFKGTYQSTFNNMDIDITIDENGKIIADQSICKLNGQIYQSTLANTVKYEINAQHCENLEPSLHGYLVKDENYAPASFRLINLGHHILDLWFYEN